MVGKPATPHRILKLVFKSRGWVMVPPMIFIMLFTDKENEHPLITYGLGGLLFGLGLLLRVWAQMHLRYRLRVHKVLTLTGPYAYARNPIYLGNTLLLVSLCFLAELPWFAPLQAAYCAVVYSFVVRYEELHLRDRYGDAYRDYCQLVGRWLPGLPAIFPARPAIREFFWPSVRAELHLLVLLVLPLAKELFL